MPIVCYDIGNIPPVPLGSLDGMALYYWGTELRFT